MTPAGTRGAGAAMPFLCFCAGIGVGWWLHAGPPAPALLSGRPPAVIEAPLPAPDRAPEGTTASDIPDIDAPASVLTTIGPDNPIDELRDKDLRLPIDDVKPESLKGSFTERRAGGRAHEAADMLAPRNTKIRAVDDGTIAKLFTSKAGGTTIYQFDSSRKFCYYYAHLERYADGLKEGDEVERGDVIGYVGTSGNAPPNTPHLHFAIFQLTPERHWWQGTPLDPYQVFRD
jgi:peptidoglycan LD-endopeptidase LytH